MTLPTKPFPDITPDPDLFDRSRRRARGRKVRRTTLVSSFVLVLAAGTGFALTQTGGSSQPKVILGNDPTPIAEPSVTPTVQVVIEPTSTTTDTQLVAMGTQCQGSCVVAGRVDFVDGRTFAVLGARPTGSQPTYGHLLLIRDVVLARGATKLDESAPPTSDAGFLNSTPRTDATTNALVEVAGGNNSIWYLPFGTIDDKLVLTQGSFTTTPISGDLNSGFVDQDVPTLRIVTGDHNVNTAGTRTETYQSWSWNGTSYVASPCVPESQLRNGPGQGCGLPAYPS